MALFAPRPAARDLGMPARLDKGGLVLSTSSQRRRHVAVALVGWYGRKSEVRVELTGRVGESVESWRSSLQSLFRKENLLLERTRHPRCSWWKGTTACEAVFRINYMGTSVPTETGPVSGTNAF